MPGSWVAQVASAAAFERVAIVDPKAGYRAAWPASVAGWRLPSGDSDVEPSTPSRRAGDVRRDVTRQLLGGLVEQGLLVEDGPSGWRLPEDGEDQR
jgi:hypothetical protein